MPGTLIPAWAKKHAKQALTPGRLTPARYRFAAAVANHANYASTKNGPCLEITPAVRCRTSLALMHKRPMGCRGGVFRVRVKACICFSVTHRERAESRQNAGICWVRAPRHYSAALLVVTRALRSVLSSCHASAWHDDDYRYMRATVGNRSIAATPFLVAIERPKPPCTQGLSARQS